MADSSPLLTLREGGPRAPRPSAPSPLPSSCSSSEPEEAELSLSLARTKTRSYGSTASVNAGVFERHVEHRVCASDTLQGIALKYGVTMEQIKRVNKLFTNDCIFLKKTLNIPVISEKTLLFNGLNSIDSPENETGDGRFSHEEGLVAAAEALSPPSPHAPDVQPVTPEEVSARDFLQRLDLQIKLSTQAAKKLKEESREDDSPYATSLYHS